MFQYDELLKVLSPVIIFLIFLSIMTLSFYLERYFTIIAFARKVRGGMDGFKDTSSAAGAGCGKINEELCHYKIETDQTLEDFRISIVKIGSVASLSPYIGLFGTVIGIMNSFSEIAKTGTSNFAYVSKGISEALIATAAGLLLAIMASFCYNHLTAELRAVNNLKNAAFEKIKLSLKGGI